MVTSPTSYGALLDSYKNRYSHVIPEHYDTLRKPQNSSFLNSNQLNHSNLNHSPNRGPNNGPNNNKQVGLSSINYSQTLTINKNTHHSTVTNAPNRSNQMNENLSHSLGGQTFSITKNNFEEIYNYFWGLGNSIFCCMKLT